MIGTVLAELKESAEAQLPSRIAAVAALHGVALDDSFATYSWWKTEADAIKVEFPALSFAWDRTTTAQRNNVHARRAKHRIVASYGYRAADMSAIERHMLYVPEALLLWLEDLPRASRSAGKTIIGPDPESSFEITHDLEHANGGVFIWSVDVKFTIVAQDSNLPARTIT
jgi:hypothetical protein